MGFTILSGFYLVLTEFRPKNCLLNVENTTHAFNKVVLMELSSLFH